MGGSDKEAITDGARVRVEAPEGSRIAESAGLALAVCFTLWFRLSHLASVPLAYNYEGLNFVGFADRLVREGFPYIPYAWYSHTLYSYAIALFASFGGPEMWAARVTAAAISIITVVTTYAATRSAFGRRAAWLSALMLSISCWHLYASRNGYHHFLMPLFQSLFVLFLNEGERRPGTLMHVLAGVTLALALHAYWGLYLLPPFLLLVLMWRLATQADERREISRAALLVGATTALLCLPLVSFLWSGTDVFEYPLGDLGGEDWRHNLSRIFSYLSGYSGANGHAGHAPCLDPLTFAAFAAGLAAASLIAFRKPSGPMAILLLLATNVIGLALSSSTFFYMSAVMFPVHALAGHGLSAAIASVGRVSERAGRIATAACIAVLVWQAGTNYRRFFHADLESMGFVEVRSEEGTGMTALPFLLADAGRLNVMIADRRPGHDFGLLVDYLREYRGYAALHDVHRFSEALLPLPRYALPREGADAVIYLRASAVLDDPLRERLAGFYPGLKTERLFPPEPYPRIPAVTKIRIPWEDLKIYHGFENGRGFVSVPEDGEAALSPGDAAGDPLELGGSRVVERGLHPFETSGDCRRATLSSGGYRIPLCDALLHVPAGTKPPVTPYMARPVRNPPYSYLPRKTIEPEIPDDHSTRLSHALYFPDGDEALAVAGPFLWRISSSGEVVGHAKLREPPVRALERVGDSAAIVYADGEIESIALPTLERRSLATLGRNVVAADSSPVGLAVIDDRSVLHLVEPGGATTERELPAEGLSGVSSLAWSGSGLELLNTVTSEWISLDSKLAVRGRRAIGAIHHGWSEIAVDPGGLTFVRAWNSPLRAYGPDGHFTPHAQRIFAAKEDRGVWRHSDLEFSGRWASAILVRQKGMRRPFRGEIHVFERSDPDQAKAWETR